MKLRMHKTLQLWVDAACEHIKRDHPNLTRRQLVAQVLPGDFAPEQEFKMTDLAGMFWLTSPRMKTSGQDDIPYTTQALKQDLLRVRNAWNESQARRDRDA